LGNETEESFTDEDFNSDIKRRPSDNDNSTSTDKQISVSDSPTSNSSDEPSINRNWLRDSDIKEEETQPDIGLGLTNSNSNTTSVTSGILEQDPWDSTLYPAEPHPTQYSTFAEYEEAMKRWALVSSTTCSFIPPHPKQLESLLDLLTSSREVTNYLFAGFSKKGNICSLTLVALA
jgi:hypothetical protein